MADWCRNQNEDGIEPPMPPMAVDPVIRIPELKNVLKQYGVDSYFEGWGRLKSDYDSKCKNRLIIMIKGGFKLKSWKGRILNPAYG